MCLLLHVCVQSSPCAFFSKSSLHQTKLNTTTVNRDVLSAVFIYIQMTSQKAAICQVL